MPFIKIFHQHKMVYLNHCENGIYSQPTQVIIDDFIDNPQRLFLHNRT